MGLYAVLALLIACSPSESEKKKKKQEEVVESADTAVIDTDTDVTDPGPQIDCDNIPDMPLDIQTFNIETTEDFDFDAEGRMVFAEWIGSTLIGVTHDLKFSIISSGIQDTRGISVLSDGRIIIAYIGFGTVGIIDPKTGGNTTLISGLASPNALEVGLGDLIYFSETGFGTGHVRQFDINTGVSEPVAGGFNYPNGMVINETHDVLYVSDSNDGIYEVPKLEDGTWGPKELLYDPDDSYDGLEVDACGNLYVLSFWSGKVVRFDPDVRPLEPTTIAELSDPGAFLWNAMHWGSDRGGWDRETLYVTDRNIIFALEMGVPGKAQPVDKLP